jgi:hypothetical protein
VEGLPSGIETRFVLVATNDDVAPIRLTYAMSVQAEKMHRLSMTDDMRSAFVSKGFDLANAMGLDLFMESGSIETNLHPESVPPGKLRLVLQVDRYLNENGWDIDVAVDGKRVGTIDYEAAVGEIAFPLRKAPSGRVKIEFNRRLRGSGDPEQFMHTLHVSAIGIMTGTSPWLAT